MTQSHNDIDKTKPFGKHCQVSRLARAEQQAHDPTQIVGHHRREITLPNFFQTAKPCATGAARVAQMGECPFDPFAALALQTTTANAGRVAPVAAVRRFTTRRFVFPCTIGLPLRFGNVGPPV